MMKRSYHHSMAGVFVFLLLGVFAVFGTLLVLLGTNAYRATIDRTASHSDTRIVETFVRHAVRGEDAENNVSVVDYDGETVLVIGDPADYASYIYVYDGWLYELYSDDGFELGAGEQLCEASGFGAVVDDHILRVMISTDDGAISVVNTALYCSQ